MPKKKRYEVKVNVSLSTELAEWLEDMVRKGVFANLSHGLRRCATIVKTFPEEVRLELEKRGE